tara:strand:- start:270 stop:470 length:201 start_codon:yes stop_codon:yes gene_type:complete
MVKYLMYENEKIPYVISPDDTVVLNENRKDYPEAINQKIFKKHPGVKYIQHNSHFVERMKSKEAKA